ncbi:MAG: hypothetical protein K9L30_06710 [Desulfobacterales bacterium]|nr:hypothetical protein [Desulfobacterales bacterium]
MGSEKKDNKFTTSYKPITIRTTDGSTLMGKINIADNSRVSDMFLSPEPFVVMIDVASKDGVHKTRFVNKAHIVWVEPDEIEE